MRRTVEAAVMQFESDLREWAQLNRRFETPGANPHQGTSRANRIAKRLVAASATLKEEPLFRVRLSTLMSDAVDQVASWAAMETLAWDPAGAEVVLERIAAGPGLVAMGAHHTLKRHREGPTPTASTRERSAPADDREPSAESEALFDDVWAFHGAAMNGGFLLAFDTAGHLVPRVEGAFRRMGQDVIADVIADGVKLFPGGVLPEDGARRAVVLDHEVDAEALEALGNKYDELIPDDRTLQSWIEQMAAD